MSDWGDIAGGFNQGMQQNVKTISELQQMNLLQDRAEREKNIFESWKRKEEEDQKPIFLDNLPVKLGPNVQDKLRNLAETQGLVNRTPDGREFVRAKHGKELLALTNSPALLSEQMKDITGEEARLKDALANTKKPEEATALQQELQKVLQGKDALSMQSKEYFDMIEKQKQMKLLEAEAAKKTALTFDQVKGQVAQGLAEGKKYPDELMKLLGVGKYAGTGGVVFDTGTGTVKYTKPEKPAAEAKLTSNVAENPDTKQNEYLMSDGSFSGKKAGAKPSNKKSLADLIKPKGEKDKFGYVVGEVKNVNGKDYKYIGNDQWQ